MAANRVPGMGAQFPLTSAAQRPQLCLWAKCPGEARGSRIDAQRSPLSGCAASSLRVGREERHKPASWRLVLEHVGRHDSVLRQCKQRPRSRNTVRFLSSSSGRNYVSILSVPEIGLRATERGTAPLFRDGCWRCLSLPLPLSQAQGIGSSAATSSCVAPRLRQKFCYRSASSLALCSCL
jgi:hypothetical protein